MWGIELSIVSITYINIPDTISPFIGYIHYTTKMPKLKAFTMPGILALLARTIGLDSSATMFPPRNYQNERMATQQVMGLFNLARVRYM